MELSIAKFKVDIFKFEVIDEFDDNERYVDTTFNIFLIHKLPNEFDGMRAYSVLNSLDKSISSYDEFVSSLIEYTMEHFKLMTSALHHLMLQKVAEQEENYNNMYG